MKFGLTRAEVQGVLIDNCRQSDQKYSQRHNSQSSHTTALVTQYKY